MLMNAVSTDHASVVTSTVRVFFLIYLNSSVLSLSLRLSVVAVINENFEIDNDESDFHHYKCFRNVTVVASKRL